MVHCMVCGEDVDDLQEHVANSHEEEEMQHALREMQPPMQTVQQVTRGENFHKDYATNWVVGFSEFDFRIDVLNESRTSQGNLFSPTVIQLISESQIIATPTAAKTLIERLSQAVDDFEKEFGEIPSDTGERRQL